MWEGLETCLLAGGQFSGAASLHKENNRLSKENSFERVRKNDAGALAFSNC